MPSACLAVDYDGQMERYRPPRGVQQVPLVVVADVAEDDAGDIDVGFLDLARNDSKGVALNVRVICRGGERQGQGGQYEEEASQNSLAAVTLLS